MHLFHHTSLFIKCLDGNCRRNFGLEIKNQLEKSNKELLEAKKDAELSNEGLSKQFTNFHSSIHNFRNEIFSHFQNVLPPDITYKKLSKDELETFEKICRFITVEVKKIFLEYLQARKIDEKDISVTVKLAMSPEKIIDFYGNNENYDLSDDMIPKIIEKNEWLFTVYRDPDTQKHYPKREVGKEFYCPDSNTAFIKTLRNKDRYFRCDNLEEAEDTYLNENKDWRKYYNATIVAPIRFKSDGDYYIYYGIIAVDSLNRSNEKLFKTDESISIIGHAADLLAIYFLTLSLYQSSEEVKNEWSKGGTQE